MTHTFLVLLRFCIISLPEREMIVMTFLLCQTSRMINMFDLITGNSQQSSPYLWIYDLNFSFKKLDNCYSNYDYTSYFFVVMWNKTCLPNLYLHFLNKNSFLKKTNLIQLRFISRGWKNENRLWVKIVVKRMATGSIQYTMEEICFTSSHTSCDWYPMKHDADVSVLDLEININKNVINQKNIESIAISLICKYVDLTVQMYTQI